MTNKISPVIALGMQKQPSDGLRGGITKQCVGSVGKSGHLTSADQIVGFQICLDILMDFTCETFKVTRDQIVKEKKAKRSGNSTEAKRFFYAAAITSIKDMYPDLATYKRIAQELGATHCSALHHVRMHKGFMEVNPGYKRVFDLNVIALQERLDESSELSLMSLRDRTVDEINLLIKRLRMVDKRLKMRDINPLFIEKQIKL